MTITDTPIPLNIIDLHDGDQVVGFRQSGHQVIIQVARAVSGPAKPRPAGKDIREWIDKWAGSMPLGEGETRDSVREAAMLERFGS